MIEIVEIGAHQLDATNNSLTVQAFRLSGEALGFVPVWGPWGHCGIPAPGTQGLYWENIGVFAFRNTGIGSVVGAMKSGDTAIYASENARTFWKEETREVTTLVRTGDGFDACCTMSGDAEKFQVAIKGTGFEMAQGLAKLLEGGSYLELASGVATLNGGPVRLGPAPANPVATGVTGVAPAAAYVPSTSVIA